MLPRFTAIFLAGCVLGLAACPGFAQSEFATKLISVTNARNSSAAVDGSPITAVAMSPPLLFGVAQLRMSFPAPVVQGTPAGLLVEPVGLLNTSVLNSLIINAYANSNAGMSRQESFPLRNLILELLPPVSDRPLSARDYF